MVLATILTLLAIFGHAALAIGMVNRLHATSVPRWTVKIASAFFYAGIALGAAGFAWWWAAEVGLTGASTPEGVARVVCLAYGGSMAVLAVVHLTRWSYYRVHDRRDRPAEHAQTVDLAARLGRRPVRGRVARLLAHLPGNELLKVTLRQRVLPVPELPAALEGLSILHLSDLHFSGRIERPYYEEVLRLASATECDLVAVTGDICDSPACISWIEPLLGRLEAPLGKFFVLGNHDLRLPDVDRLRSALGRAGYVDLGGNWRAITAAGEPVWLAGNELPWFAPAASRRPPGDANTAAFKILLTHTPDQFEWAEDCGFDLMLAGHTHGGQIRLPWIGSILCPSRFGTRYACGTFRRGRTLMHVSRGVSSLTPVRFNCAPELVKLVLTRSGKVAGRQKSATATA